MTFTSWFTRTGAALALTAGLAACQTTSAGNGVYDRNGDVRIVAESPYRDSTGRILYPTSDGRVFRTSVERDRYLRDVRQARIERRQREIEIEQERARRNREVALERERRRDARETRKARRIAVEIDQAERRVATARTNLTRARQVLADQRRARRDTTQATVNVRRAEADLQDARTDLRRLKRAEAQLAQASGQTEAETRRERNARIFPTKQ